MNNELPSNTNSNLNSSEEVYLSLVHSYINATRDILNGYMTFETGLTRAINSQIFRNFTRSSITVPITVANERVVATQPESAPEQSEPVVETPVNLIRGVTMEIPETPVRPTLRFRSSLSSAPSSPFQIPTPVRLTSRLDTPPEERESREPRFMLPRRVGLSQPQSQQPQSQQPQSQSNLMRDHEPSLQTSSQNVTTSTTPTPPFASSFVRYRLPVPIGPPRRVSATNANSSETLNTNPNTNTSTSIALEVPIISPTNSPPGPPGRSFSPIIPATQTWQQLRQQRQRQQQQQQQQLNSLSPILPVETEPTPLPPAPVSLTSTTRMMLNLLDTPRMNDTLVYYTQIIDRELTRSRQGQANVPLSYDVIQQQTKIIPYCTIINPLNDICPISQIQFDLIDSVMQINICKHNFNPYSLLRWFDTNSTCPMCRQQINIRFEENDDDEETVHMYNNGREEEPYRLTESNRNYESNYDDSDFSSVG